MQLSLAFEKICLTVIQIFVAVQNFMNRFLLLKIRFCFNLSDYFALLLKVLVCRKSTSFEICPKTSFVFYAKCLQHFFLSSHFKLKIKILHFDTLNLFLNQLAFMWILPASIVVDVFRSNLKLNKFPKIMFAILLVLQPAKSAAIHWLKELYVFCFWSFKS
jgi:hypothetical protein